VNTEFFSRNRKRWVWLAAFVAVFTLLALLSSVNAYVMQLTYDKPVSWGLALRRSFKEWLICGVITLGVLWWCGRNQLKPGRTMRWVAAHIGASFLFSLAYVVLLSLIMTGEVSVQTGQILTFSYLFKKMAIHSMITNMILYWVVVAFHRGWHYYQRYREREREAAALATELVQARLQALRMQINPHFLFNTLHTISSLIHSQPETADRMVARLSELLRATLDQGEMQEVPLREEIDFLKRYLEIEQMRFSDRLIVAFDIEPRTQELLVPHLILQPLVENALRHGIEPREEPGRIEIHAQVMGAALELKVRDNGNGLADGDGLPAREGIGLKNVRSRLLHLYGDAQSFTIQNTPGGGVEACVRLPCCTVRRSQAPRVVVMSPSEVAAASAALPAGASAKPDCSCP
jgi:sensor histidine kinase YesM